MICPLCSSISSEVFSNDRKRNYLKCLTCSLVYVPDSFHLTTVDEKRRYDSHNNSSENVEYQEYLQTIIQKLGNLSQFSSSLDFGSGKSTYLRDHLRELGLNSQVYDPYFHSDKSVLESKYDLILVIEVIEHVRDFQSFIEQLRVCSTSATTIMIKTALYPEAKFFNDWYYKRDLTHIQFFSLPSLELVAKKLEKKIVTVDGDLFILK